MNWARFSVRGTPSTSASMFAPNVSCSWVCLYRLFSTTLATASRLSTITSRMPVRPEDSSRMSAMPASLPSLTSSAIRSARLSGLTWYGSSVTTSVGAAARGPPRPRRPRASGSSRDRCGTRPRSPSVPTIRPSVGKSGPLTIVDQLRRASSASSTSGLSRHHCTRRGDLAQVVRRDLGGHADRDALGAVDQQVRDPRRQDRRLLRPAVVVGLKSTVSSSMSRSISIASGSSRDSVLWLTKPFVMNEWSSVSTRMLNTGCTPASVDARRPRRSRTGRRPAARRHRARRRW